MGVHADADQPTGATVGDGRDDRGGARVGRPHRRTAARRRVGRGAGLARARRGGRRRAGGCDWMRHFRARGDGRRGDPARRVAFVGLRGSGAGVRPGVRARPRSAGGRRRDRDQPRGRNDRDDGGDGCRSWTRRRDDVDHRERGLTGGGRRRRHARHRRDGPRLVPHRGVPVPDRRRVGDRLGALGRIRCPPVRWVPGSSPGSRPPTPPARTAAARTRSSPRRSFRRRTSWWSAPASTSVTARELALKVEEAAWVPSAVRDLETFLHGHLPATGPETALLLILTERAGLDARAKRARQALAAAASLGMRPAAILGADAAALIPESLTPGGRIVVPEAPGPARRDGVAARRRRTAPAGDARGVRRPWHEPRPDPPRGCPLPPGRRARRRPEPVGLEPPASSRFDERLAFTPAGGARLRTPSDRTTGFPPRNRRTERPAGRSPVQPPE